MKRLLASLLAGASMVTAFWFNVAPNAATMCATPSYSVQRPDKYGVMQTLTLNKSVHTQLCNMVKNFPA